MDAMNKEEARKQGLAKRKALSEAERHDKSTEIFSVLKPYILSSICVGTYVSMKEEAETDQILSYCFMHKIRVCVPKTVGNTLEFHEIASKEDLAIGNYGVQEPIRGKIVPCSEIDLMIVPLSAFDQENHRTGYGKGYYDSVLGQCSLKIGIAFAEQKVDHIEADSWDVTLDRILSF